MAAVGRQSGGAGHGGSQVSFFPIPPDPKQAFVEGWEFFEIIYSILNSLVLNENLSKIFKFMGRFPREFLEILEINSIEYKDIQTS